MTGCDVQFAAVTIACWYYTARHQRDDPVGTLRRSVRKDSRKVSLAGAIAERLICQYAEYPALELPTALRQPCRFSTGQPNARATTLLFHSQTLHAGVRLSEKAEASASRAPR